jgi:hypothetical protein
MKEILLDVSNEKNLRLELSLIVNEIKKTIKYQFNSYQYKTKTDLKKESSFRTKKMSIRLYFLLICITFFIGIKGKLAPNGKLSQRINYLLNLTESEKKFNSVLEAYITNDPSLSIYKTEIMSFVNKFLSFQSLRSHIVQIYHDLYTLSEINGLIKFYSSSLGKKLIENEIKAEIRLTQLIKNQLQKQMPQIISWFQQALSENYSNNQTIQSIH